MATNKKTTNTDKLQLLRDMAKNVKSNVQQSTKQVKVEPDRMLADAAKRQQTRASLQSKKVNAYNQHNTGDVPAYRRRSDTPAGIGVDIHQQRRDTITNLLRDQTNGMPTFNLENRIANNHVGATDARKWAQEYRDMGQIGAADWFDNAADVLEQNSRAGEDYIVKGDPSFLNNEQFQQWITGDWKSLYGDELVDPNVKNFTEPKNLTGTDLKGNYNAMLGYSQGAANMAGYVGSYADQARNSGDYILEKYYRDMEPVLNESSQQYAEQAAEMIGPEARKRMAADIDLIGKDVNRVGSELITGGDTHSITDAERSTAASNIDSKIAQYDEDIAALEAEKAALEQEDSRGNRKRIKEIEDELNTKYTLRDSYVKAKDTVASDADIKVYDDDALRDIESYEGLRDYRVMLEDAFMDMTGNLDFAVEETKRLENIEMQESWIRAVGNDMIANGYDPATYINDQSDFDKGLYNDDDLHKYYTDEERGMLLYAEQHMPNYTPLLREVFDVRADGRRNEAWADKLTDTNPAVNLGLAVGGRIFSTINGADISIQNWLGFGKTVNYERTGFGTVLSDKAMERGMEDIDAWLGDGTINEKLDGVKVFGQQVKVPILGDLKWSDLYSSGADSLTAALNSAAGPYAAPVVTGLQAYASGYHEAKERGASDEQAKKNSRAQAFNEGLGEKVSYDVFLKYGVEKGWFKGAWGKVALGAARTLDEAQQEGATQWLNEFAEDAFMGASSQRSIDIQNYVAAGYTPEEAAAMADEARGDRIAKAAIMGAIGGLSRGVSQGTIGTVRDVFNRESANAAIGRDIRKSGNTENLTQQMSLITGKDIKAPRTNRGTGKLFNEYVKAVGKDPALAMTVSKMTSTSAATKDAAETRKNEFAVSEDGKTTVGGKEVKIQGINDTKKASSEIRVNVSYADNTTGEVKLSDINFGDDKAAEVYSYAADMPTPSIANIFRTTMKTQSLDNIDRVATGFTQAYDMGRAGYRNIETVANSPLTKALTAEQVKMAYEQGVADRAEAQQKNVKEVSERVKAAMGKEWKGGTVTFDGVDAETMNDTQKRQVELATAISGMLGINVRFYESGVRNNTYQGANGSYNRKTNTISLDINAGRNRVSDSIAQTALLKTMSHEITHAIQRNSPEQYEAIREAVLDVIGKTKGVSLDTLVNEKMVKDKSLKSREAAVDEVVADACETMLRDSDAVKQLMEAHPEAAKSFKDTVLRILDKLLEAIRAAFNGNRASRESQLIEREMKSISELWSKAVVEVSEVSGREIAISEETQKRIDNDQPISGIDEIKNSIRFDEKYMAVAEAKNKTYGFVSNAVLEQTAKDRAVIRDFFRDPNNAELLKLPADVTGNTFLANASYVGSEENTTVCIRSMAAQQLMDAISKQLGRPLTVRDTLLVSQEIAALTDKPECFYCYVATDRRAYREYLGSYLEQRDAVIKKYRNGADRESLYKEFLNGRDDTPNMRERYDMWLEAVDKGIDLITGSDVASLEEMFAELGNHKKNRKRKLSTSRLDQLWDAASYAQSASWAKKMIGYAAYNNHILKWSQKRINELNSGYGLRMYSFSDYSPAFVLENMQMITDAAVRGLNVLAYTKEMDFAEIFAPSGANINVSVFASEVNGEIISDAMQGADWDRAQELRSKYPNVGTVMVATSDNIMRWAMEQDWIDVVIPYHLVRTGQEVADYFGYKNYTAVSGDKKTLSYKKGDPTSVSPVEHHNDIVNYVDALQKYGLSPRFAEQMQGYDQYVAGEITPEQFRAMNPYYMKLVNETRRSYADTKPVQPVFNVEAAKTSIDAMIKQGGYYQPIGGSLEAQNDIAEEVADKIRESGKGSGDDVQFMARDGVEFLEDKYFIKRLKNYDKEKHGGYIHVGRILENSVLNRIGVPATDLYYDNSKIYATLNSHDDHLDVETLSKIPEILRDPTVVVEYSKDNINVYGETWVGKSPLLIGILITRTNSGASVINKVRTVHARRNAGEWINDDSVLYLNEDKKRTLDWFQALGTHLPLGGTKFGFIRSIALSGHLVNTETQYSSRDYDEPSDREVLVNALESAARTEDERVRLAAYKENLERLNGYQAELDKNKATVRDVSKKRAAERTETEAEELAKARARIKMLNEKMADIDAALVNLETMKPIKNVVEREREKVRAERNAVMREKIEGLHDTQNRAARRASIIRRVKRLDQLVRNATDQKHIPDGLGRAIIDLMKNFTQDTSVFDKKRLANIQNEYAALAESNLDSGSLYTEDIKAMLSDLGDLIGGKRLSALTFDELSMVRDIVGHFEKLVKDANSIFVEGRRQSIDEITVKLVEETSGKNYKASQLKASSLYKWLTKGQITPIYFFEQLGGEMGRLGKAIIEGQGRFGVLQEKAHTRLRQIKQQYGYDNWAHNKKDTKVFVTEEGKKLELTREQALGIYATAKRERSNRLQKASHLAEGGVILKQSVEDLPLIKGKEVKYEGTPLSNKDVSAIEAWLTDQQKEYADAMVGYISKDMAELGNETSMKLHGYRKFGEGYYYPYKTSSDFRKTDLSKVENALMKNMSFTHRVQRHADNPIVLSDFSQTVAEHVEAMLRYNALAVEQDSFMRVFDHHLSKSETVQTLLKNAYGKNTTDYILQFMKDIYGGMTRDSNEAIGSKWLARYKKSAVMFSLSTAIQQMSSLPRAFAEVNMKYFVGKAHTGSFKEAKQYAGTAVIKDMGSFDTYNGRNAADWLNDSREKTGWARFMRGVDTVGGYLPEKLDQLTWGRIWEAVKREQADKTGLDINSEELKVIAGKRFDEVVTKTQVFDSVMAKSQNMRDSSLWMKMVTSFMGEPTVTYNMLYNAIANAKTNPGKASAVLGSVLTSIILNAALKSIVTGARDDDDEKSRYSERYIKNFFADLVNGLNPLEYIPFIKDAWSIFKGFKVERTDMEVFNLAYDFWKLLQDEDRTWDQTLNTTTSFVSMLTGLPFKNIWKDINGVGNTFRAIFGDKKDKDSERVPREWREGWFGSSVKRGLSEGAILSLRFDDSKSANVDAMYEHLLDGDIEAANDSRKYLIDYNGVNDDKAVNTLLRTRIKEGFEDGDISREKAAEMLHEHTGLTKTEADRRVSEWAYKVDTDVAYGDIKEKFMDGDMTAEEAIEARVEYGGADEEDAEATIRKWEYEKETGFAYDDMKDAYLNGEITKKQVIDARVKYGGVSRADAESTVAKWDFEVKYGAAYSEMGDAYIRGDLTEKQAVASLMEYGGMREPEALQIVAEWDYEKATGRKWSEMKDDYINGDMTAAQVLKARTTYSDEFESDINAQIKKWDYERDTGRPYNDMKAAYIDGEISNKQAIADRVKYGGMDQEDAELDVSKWDFEVDYGYDYNDMDEHFKLGNINKNEAIAARVKYGKQKEDDAYFAVTGWEYEQQTGKEWKGKTTKVRDAIDKGDVNAMTVAMTEVYEHSDYKDEDAAASAMTTAITNYYKPLYIAATPAEREAMEGKLLDAYELAYTLVGKKYYGDNRRLKTIRKWLEED